jgi:hypothetical protein
VCVLLRDLENCATRRDLPGKTQIIRVYRHSPMAALANFLQRHA